MIKIPTWWCFVQGQNRFSSFIKGRKFPFPVLNSVSTATTLNRLSSGSTANDTEDYSSVSQSMTDDEDYWFSRIKH